MTTTDPQLRRRMADALRVLCADAVEQAKTLASIDNLSAADQSTAKRQDFRYIKVDGIVPSIENAAAGKGPVDCDEPV